MESTITEKKYELMLIVDANINSEAKEAILKEVTDIIGKSGGKVINSQVWQEKQKLTFAIKKIEEGTYYLINYEANSDVNEKMHGPLKLNEKVLRFVITNI